MSVIASRLVLSVGKSDEPCEIAFCCTLPLFVQFRTRSTIQNKDGTRQHNVLGFLSQITPSLQHLCQAVLCTMRVSELLAELLGSLFHRFRQFLRDGLRCRM